MARPRINERSAYTKTFQVQDSTGAAVIPSTLRYRLDCVTTQTQVLDWVVLTPALSITLNIGAPYNAIVNTASNVETKRITVAANYGTSSQIIDYHEYDVLNSEFYSA